MDSEHVAPKRVDSRIVPVAVDRWKAVFKKKQKGHWSRDGRGDTGAEVGEVGEVGERGEDSNSSVVLVSSMSSSMRNGIVSGPLDFVPLKWLSTTGRLA
jgi:hypothetical protein